MAFTLGQGPETLSVLLVEGADFVHALRRQDGTSWGDTDQILLEIRTRGSDGSPVWVAWPADLTGAIAQWNVDAADVSAVIAARPSLARLWFLAPNTAYDPDGGNPQLRLLWAQGDVEVV